MFLSYKTLSLVEFEELDGTIHLIRLHFLGGGVKNWPNLLTDSSKKLQRQVGGDQKLGNFAKVLNGWSHTALPVWY